MISCNFFVNTNILPTVEYRSVFLIFELKMIFFSVRQRNVPCYLVLQLLPPLDSGYITQYQTYENSDVPIFNMIQVVHIKLKLYCAIAETFLYVSDWSI